jgi:predicted anti-sigma-YlaC factor YlaD
MRCFRARRMLVAYLDNEVYPRQRASLESHLTGCEACSDELAKLRAEWDALAEGDHPPLLPSDFWCLLLKALDEAGRLPWHRRYRARVLQAACVTACVVLGFASGALLLWRYPVVGAPLNDVFIGERMMVAEAFDTTAFGLSEGKEGLLRCVPK